MRNIWYKIISSADPKEERQRRDIWYKTSPSHSKEGRYID
jgi:hypothetical protein